MNINQIKSILADKPAHLGSESSVQNQLRDSGLKQAVSLQAKQLQARSDEFNSSTTFGARVYASALSSNIEINTLRPDFSVNKSSKVTKPLFDFEEVAKNVLKFVGGALKGAKQNGADDDELNRLFEQATSGVLKGIKMAEKDLAGFMNDEIRAGIDSSKALIQQGIEKLKQALLPSEEKLEAEKNGEVVQSVSQTNIAIEQQKTGELYIKTRDGDEVRLSFEDVRQFKLNQQVTIQNATTSTSSGAKDNADIKSASDVKPTQAANSIEGEQAPEQQKDDTNPDESAKVIEQPKNTLVEQNSIYYSNNALSFSVSGELDESELKAIGQLVADANDLADEFFYGDIEAAYNQALSLGFDDQELVGYALQLTKVENTQVIKTYEAVSHYDSEDINSESTKAAKPVAHYLDKMLGVVEESRLKLQDNESFENMVNELINRMGEVHTPDLIHAINRFHSFNQKLLDNLPLTFK